MSEEKKRGGARYDKAGNLLTGRKKTGKKKRDSIAFSDDNKEFLRAQGVPYSETTNKALDQYRGLAGMDYSEIESRVLALHGVSTPADIEKLMNDAPEFKVGTFNPDRYRKGGSWDQSAADPLGDIKSLAEKLRTHKFRGKDVTFIFPKSIIPALAKEEGGACTCPPLPFTEPELTYFKARGFYRCERCGAVILEGDKR